MCYHKQGSIIVWAKYNEWAEWAEWNKGIEWNEGIEWRVERGNEGLRERRIRDQVVLGEDDPLPNLTRDDELTPPLLE